MDHRCRIPTVPGKGDVSLLVEYASYLFRKLLLDDASRVFDELAALSMSSQERRMIREKWKADDGRPRVFSGTIDRFAGARGRILAIPENFYVYFWRDSRTANNQREGSTVRFTVGFTAQGPEARIMNVQVPDRLTVH